MQSDPMWGTCMAMNVYFVIFRRWDSKKLKQMFKWYILVCYGVPFIPAMFCLWYRSQKNGRVYGDATVRRLPSLDFHLTDILFSFGVGLTINGKLSVSTLTTDPFGATSSSPFSSTSASAMRSSASVLHFVPLAVATTLTLLLSLNRVVRWIIVTHGMASGILATHGLARATKVFNQSLSPAPVPQKLR